MASTWIRLAKSPRARRSAILVVLWAVILGLLFAIREVLLPFFIAVLLAYVIDPVVRRVSLVEVRGRRLPRWGSVLTIYSGAFLALWLSAVFVVPQLYGEVERLWRTTAGWLQQVDQGQIERAAERLDRMADRLGLPVRVIAAADAEPVGPVPGAVDPGQQKSRAPASMTERQALIPVPLDDDDDVALDDLAEGEGEATLVYTVNLTREMKTLLSTAAAALQDQTGAIAVRVQALVGGVFGFVFKFFLVLMITAFLAVDTDRIKRFFFSLLPLEDRGPYDDLLTRIDRGLSGVVRGQLTICFVNGLLTLVGLLVLKVKFAFILATMAALFSLIPIFGSIASTIPIVMVALGTSGVGTAVLALAWIIGIHALEANLLNPKIMGESARIHPVVVVLALITGEHFYGIPGALFAVPVASIGVTIFRSLQARAQRLEQQHVAPARRGKEERPRPPRRHREPLS